MFDKKFITKYPEKVKQIEYDISLSKRYRKLLKSDSSIEGRKEKMKIEIKKQEDKLIRQLQHIQNIKIDKLKLIIKLIKLLGE